MKKSLLVAGLLALAPAIRAHAAPLDLGSTADRIGDLLKASKDGDRCEEWPERPAHDRNRAGRWDVRVGVCDGEGFPDAKAQKQFWILNENGTCSGVAYEGACAGKIRAGRWYSYDHEEGRPDGGRMGGGIVVYFPAVKAKDGSIACPATAYRRPDGPREKDPRDGHEGGSYDDRGSVCTAQDGGRDKCWSASQVSGPDRRAPNPESAASNPSENQGPGTLYHYAPVVTQPSAAAHSSPN